MKCVVSTDALVAHLEGEAVLLHAGTKSYYRLNETGQVIWRQVEQGHDVDNMVSALVAEFDVEAAEARTEIERLLGELQEAGFLSCEK